MESTDCVLYCGDSFKYAYDPAGNITSIDKQRKGVEADSGLYQYGYDQLGRLIEANHNNNTKLYNYDNLGNRISSIQNGVETKHSYNSRNQLIRTEGIDTKEYSYDKRGNLTEIAENGQLKQRFTFDATNMMVGALTANKGNAEYTYNGFRNRVKKLENLQTANEATPDPTRELRYTLDMTLPYDNLLMTQGSENRSFVWGSSLLEASGSHYYLQDHLGSPIRLLNNEDSDTTLAYDEFGVPLVSVAETQEKTANLNNPFGFTGYQADDISGLYYSQARYYEPSVGRFGAEDLIKSGFNWYGYCNGNPIKFIDPLGSEFLYAELLVSADRKDEVFEYYMDMERLTESNDIDAVPYFIKDKLPDGHEVDYFHKIFSSVQIGPNFNIIVETQEKHIIFMREKDGNVLVVLLASHPDWMPYNQERPLFNDDE